MTVTVGEGDVLYLPALWFHKVSQKPSKDPEAPLAIAVNVSVRDLRVSKPMLTRYLSYHAVVVRPGIRLANVESSETG